MRYLRKVILAVLLVVSAPLAGRASGTNSDAARLERWFAYTNVVIDEIPWSIHIVRLDRNNHAFEFVTTLGRGSIFGMATVSDQLKTLPRELGQPLAAINGDFYDKSEKYEGRPRDLQIFRGEIVSSPAGHSCFWVAPDGSPQMTNIHSRIRVVWPNGTTTPISLNQERANDAAVLYTPRIGMSTRTSGGSELILESTNGSSLHPLRIGQTVAGRVREIRAHGDSPVSADTLVLSLGPGLTPPVPVVSPGAILHLAMETVPDLAGVTIAIGGGPALVHESKPMHWSGFLKMRHPRSAVGWNKDHIFMVEVDGRQSNISLGMTFPELADYMIKLGCSEAVNLDGGGSATLWALGSVRNSPSEGDERPAANALVVIRRKAN